MLWVEPSYSNLPAPHPEQEPERIAEAERFQMDENMAAYREEYERSAASTQST